MLVLMLYFLQKDKLESIKAVVHASRGLITAEKEGLSIILGIKKFRIFGSKKEYPPIQQIDCSIRVLVC